MKQEILCPDCAADIRRLYPTDDPYPGEHVKFLPGKGTKQFRCDSCGADIAKDMDCTAFSSWADYGGVPYYPWEQDYIKTRSPR